MLLQPGDVLEVVDQRTFGDLLHVLQPDESLIAVVHGVEPRRRVDDLEFRIAVERLVDRPAPAGVERPRDHLRSVADR